MPTAKSAESRRLYFYFDYISHNAYLAWCLLRPLAQGAGLTLTPVPVLFAGLLSHYKQVGPAEVPAKGRWMLWNVLRKAQQHGIPLAPPHSHPFNPLLALRLSSAAMSDTQRLQVVDRLFRATWAEGRAVSKAIDLQPLLADMPVDAEALLAAAGKPEVKQRLRDQTEQALADGVFGVPTMRVGKELFWGFDDLPFLQQYLDGKDPLGPDRKAYQAWLAVRPTAERKRP